MDLRSAEPSTAAAGPPTSDIPFFSSLHGARRRVERGIDRRDLQAAVKHGLKQQAKNDPYSGAKRWRYTYADVVYITDHTSTQEITSWVKPIGIPKADLTLKQIGEHEAAKERLQEDPSLCTSHTVIIVDQSGSMRGTDVADFYNRSQAVFGMLALDFVAKPRLSGDSSDTDVVSLVTMQDSAEVVVEREPVGLVLYNQFVALHDVATPGQNGNFLPALDLAEELLKSQAHGECALSLMFLSDGRPSDHAAYVRSGSRHEVEGMITGRMRALAETFGEQLTVGTLGFAGAEEDFSVLEAMAEAAREGGAQGKFYRPELSSTGLGTAIADSVSSLTSTRLRLTTLAENSKQPRELRKVEREAAGTPWGHAPTTAQTGDGWVVYTGGVRRHELSSGVKRHSKNPWNEVDFFSEETNGIAIRSKALGEGAERLVFGLQELNSRCGVVVGPKMVAKQSRHVGAENDTMDFHRSFAMTQVMAQRIAKRFNGRVRRRLNGIHPDGRMMRVWDISFLPCSVYTFLDGGSFRSVLVEKKLIGRYTKFNGNNGYVRGDVVETTAGAGAASPAGAHGAEAQTRAAVTMGVIEECDEDDDSDSDGASCASRGDEDGAPDEEDAEVLLSSVHDDDDDGVSTLFSFDPSPECFVQAFSHFSYRNSGRKMLVCDLQGVQSRSAVHEDRAGVFELTDPVIHYRSKSGRRQVYGRTDLGKKGMHKFFQTHDCNDVCCLMGLSR
ncbi:unnamed protein product [Pylaiella littoralis]